jgi:predicted O-methyltransferase YrrM
MTLTAKDLTDGKEPVSHAEIDYLKELATDLPSSPIIVNIGAATGVSTVAFLEARPDCRLYSVDVLPCEQEIQNVRRAGLKAHHVVRLLGDSKLLGPRFPLQCDLLFIDGDHWNARGDIEAWVETGKVKAGGVIALHDWQPNGCAPNNPGSVTEHVREWREEHPEFAYLGEVERVIAFRMP